jgi:hypothetical protein
MHCEVFTVLIMFFPYLSTLFKGKLNVFYSRGPSILKYLINGARDEAGNVLLVAEDEREGGGERRNSLESML